jgi:tetratricopeptide (TPR) repeat protein
MKIFLLLLTGASLAFSQSATEWKAKGDALEAAGKTKEALAAYQKAEQLSPNDAAILIKIAKQYGDMMPKLDKAAAKSAAESSLAYSRRAVKIAPQSSDSHLALALSHGKSTAYLSNSEKIKASREIKTSAEKALKLNPKSDYAHHMLGRWHQEIAEIDAASRVIAKLIYGSLPEGSYQEALGHFAKARAINSQRLIHQLEYGRTLAMMGKKTEAKAEIQKGLAMPNKEADDADSKRRAQETLNRL